MGTVWRPVAGEMPVYSHHARTADVLYRSDRAVRLAVPAMIFSQAPILGLFAARQPQPLGRGKAGRTWMRRQAERAKVTHKSRAENDTISACKSAMPASAPRANLWGIIPLFDLRQATELLRSVAPSGCRLLALNRRWRSGPVPSAAGSESRNASDVQNPLVSWTLSPTPSQRGQGRRRAETRCPLSYFHDRFVCVCPGLRPNLNFFAICDRASA